jgi:hypothetical protein
MLTTEQLTNSKPLLEGQEYPRFSRDETLFCDYCDSCVNDGGSSLYIFNLAGSKRTYLILCHGCVLRLFQHSLEHSKNQRIWADMWLEKLGLLPELTETEQKVIDSLPQPITVNKEDGSVKYNYTNNSYREIYRNASKELANV